MLNWNFQRVWSLKQKTFCGGDMDIFLNKTTVGVKFYIDLIHKWQPIYYSFIFMPISLPSLVSMNVK